MKNIISQDGKKIHFGNGTECALLECVCKKDKYNYQEYKQKYKTFGYTVGGLFVLYFVVFFIYDIVPFHVRILVNDHAVR